MDSDYSTILANTFVWETMYVLGYTPPSMGTQCKPNCTMTTLRSGFSAATPKKPRCTRSLLQAQNRHNSIQMDPIQTYSILPSTPYISWIWREKKSRSIGMDKCIFELNPAPTDRHISTLSKIQRESRWQDIEDALVSTEWRQKTQELHERYKNLL